MHSGKCPIDCDNTVHALHWPNAVSQWEGGAATGAGIAYKDGAVLAHGRGQGRDGLQRPTECLVRECVQRSLGVGGLQVRLDSKDPWPAGVFAVYQHQKVQDLKLERRLGKKQY